MDKIEKEIIQKYGTRTISTEECKDILDKAAREGVIERKDIKQLDPMPASALIEHISCLRRRFLTSDGDNYSLNDEIYEGVCNSNEDSVVLDNVIKAFIAYEKLRTKPRKGSAFYYLIIPIILFLGFLTLYRPAPY